MSRFFLQPVARAMFAPARRFSTGFRRPRKYVGQAKAVTGSLPYFGKPYEHSESSTEEYLAKCSLSPWAPIPDSVARKIMDMTQAKPDDFHVDLGSGDGKVNFHAIDYGVKKSLGIDIDSGIVQVARDRLAKRHPAPDLEFIVADLMDPDNPAWLKVREATIISMYFAEEALEVFRPLLELQLAGVKCKIVCCGYEMPEWQAKYSEVVLGTQIHLYEWGSDDLMEVNEEHEAILNGVNDFVERQSFQSSGRFKEANTIDRTSKFGIPGFNPYGFNDEEDDDADFYTTGDESDENEAVSEGKVATKRKDKDVTVERTESRKLE